MFPPCNFCGHENHWPADLGPPIRRIEKWSGDPAELVVQLTMVPLRHEAIYRCFECALGHAADGQFGPNGVAQLEAARARIMELRTDPTSDSYRDPANTPWQFDPTIEVDISRPPGATLP